MSDEIKSSFQNIKKDDSHHHILSTQENQKVYNEITQLKSDVDELKSLLKKLLEKQFTVTASPSSKNESNIIEQHSPQSSLVKESSIAHKQDPLYTIKESKRHKTPSPKKEPTITKNPSVLSNIKKEELTPSNTIIRNTEQLFKNDLTGSFIGSNEKEVEGKPFFTIANTF